METNSETELKLSALTNLPDALNLQLDDLFLVSLLFPTSTFGKYEYFSRKAKLQNFPVVDETNNGFMTAADKRKLNSIEAGATKLPIASATKLGGIKVGDGLEISLSGVLAIASSGAYVLSAATSTRLGGLKVGYKADLSEAMNKFAIQLATDTNNKDKAFVEIPSFEELSQFKSGLVSKPSSLEAKQGYLRGDGTWAMPPGTKYERVTANSDGLCPNLPSVDSTLKFLRGDGNWEKISDSKLSFDDIYPVGSIYISANKDLPVAFTTGRTWKRIAEGKCLFGANSNGYYAEKKVGESVNPGIPKPSIECNYASPTATTNVSLANLTTDLTGEHTHINNAYSPGPGPLDIGDNVGGYTRSSTGKAGIHSHKITGTATATTKLTGGSVTANIKQDGIYGKSETVQPPALVVSMWQRIK